MTTPSDFTFALPDDWVRIRVDDDQAQQDDVRSVAREVTRGRPDRDQLLPHVVQLLTDATAAHRTGHTVEVYLALALGSGLPVVAALTVDVVPPRAAPGDVLALRAAFLTAGALEGTAELAELATGPVARSRRRVATPLPDGSALESEVVQYQHPVPGGGFVLLSFSTPQLQLLEPLSALFDAVAGSFRWLP